MVNARNIIYTGIFIVAVVCSSELVKLTAAPLHSGIHRNVLAQAVGGLVLHTVTPQHRQKIEYSSRSKVVTVVPNSLPLSPSLFP
ncbi:MAG: hypothetical protein ABSB95_04000 [Dissulfurispiraceae bacterium]|jgi:hypothetical protein